MEYTWKMQHEVKKYIFYPEIVDITGMAHRPKDLRKYKQLSIEHTHEILRKRRIAKKPKGPIDVIVIDSSHSSRSSSSSSDSSSLNISSVDMTGIPPDDNDHSMEFPKDHEVMGILPIDPSPPSSNECGGHLFETEKKDSRPLYLRHLTTTPTHDKKGISTPPKGRVYEEKVHPDDPDFFFFQTSQVETTSQEFQQLSSFLDGNS